MKFLSHYFTTRSISLGFLSALSASAFIYLEHFGLHWAWLEALLGIVALASWLTLSAYAMAWSGFFTGMLWFWWIALSFRYYDLAWMIPLVVLAVGGVYGLWFRAVAIAKHPLMRAILLLPTEWIHPFGFDWFRPALLFTDSVLGDRFWQYGLILGALGLFGSIKSPARYLFLATIPFAWHHPRPTDPSIAALPSRIELVETKIPQDKKWDPRYRDAIVGLDFQAIDLAIDAGKEAVVLPESAFPLYLNRHADLVERLLKRSEKITIVAGALFTDGRHPFNSTYLFRNGRMRVMHKVVLVPFGEANPLPGWMGHWINDLFFDGASDYVTAPHPSDFTMLGHTWRNAICYEATSERLFVKNPELMVAISNNAWFTPSIQPTLQRLLMRLMHHRHGTIIFHATNGPGTGVVGIGE